MNRPRDVPGLRELADITDDQRHIGAALPRENVRRLAG